VFKFFLEIKNREKEDESQTHFKLNEKDSISYSTLSQCSPILSKLSFIHFAFLLVFSGMEFTLTFLTHDRYQFSHSQQGYLLGFIGIISALIQGGYVRRVAHYRMTEKSLVIQGILVCGIGLFCLSGIIGSGWMTVFIGALCLAFTSGTVVNCLTSLASLTSSYLSSLSSSSSSLLRSRSSSSTSVESSSHGMVSHSQHGEIMGRFRSAGQLGRSMGPIFACILYWILGSQWCYCLGSLSMIFVTILVLGIPSPFTSGIRSSSIPNVNNKLD